ncbi:MAG: hypothetical protein AAF198_09845 [Pseudomonadota bacterium]
MKNNKNTEQKDGSREERLRKQLRENLKRRKSQAKGRKAEKSENEPTKS